MTRGLALLEIPYDVPFIAVTEQAFTRLVNEQYALLQRSIAAQERLQRIVPQRARPGVDRRRARHARRRHGAGLRRARRAPGPQHLPPRARRRRGAASSASSCASARGAASRVSSCPRAAAWRCRSARRTPRDGGLPQAWLVAAKDEGGLAEIDRLILHQAVTVIALELLRRRVADTTERRLAGDVLSAAITGELEGARARAPARAVRARRPRHDDRARSRASAARRRASARSPRRCAASRSARWSLSTGASSAR